MPKGIEWKTRRASCAQSYFRRSIVASKVLRLINRSRPRTLQLGPFSHVLPHCRAVPSRSPSRILNHSLSEDKKYQGAARMPKNRPV